MPEMGAFRNKRRYYSESMVDWAMRWDEWAESRNMDLGDWREHHGYDDGERPCKPGPISFVLDLAAFAPAAESGRR
jgi:hypothetical protein